MRGNGGRWLLAVMRGGVPRGLRALFSAGVRSPSHSFLFLLPSQVRPPPCALVIPPLALSPPSPLPPLPTPRPRRHCGAADVTRAEPAAAFPRCASLSPQNRMSSIQNLQSFGKSPLVAPSPSRVAVELAPSEPRSVSSRRSPSCSAISQRCGLRPPRAAWPCAPTWGNRSEGVQLLAGLYQK